MARKSGLVAPLGIKSFWGPARSGVSELPSTQRDAPFALGSVLCQRGLLDAEVRQLNAVLKPSTFCGKWESELFLFGYLRFHPTRSAPGILSKPHKYRKENPFVRAYPS